MSFRPAAMPTIATFAAIALFASAGVWQHSRMKERLALGAKLEAATRDAAVPLPRTGDWPGWRFRPVVVTGTFDAAHQILIDNKVHAGTAGFDVVTPLALADGRAVLVDRGWIAAGPSRAQLPQVPPPAGVVAVVGRINLPASGYFELSRNTVSGALWQNLDPARFAQATGVPVLPIVVEQTAAIGAGDDLVRDRPAPDTGADRNRIYMVQWFLFAAIAAGLWIFFSWRK
jgi:surfeit locus 1 family protein